MENIYIVLLLFGIASLRCKAMVPDTAAEEGLSYDRRIRRAAGYNGHGGGTGHKVHWPPLHRKITKHLYGKMPPKEYELKATYGNGFKVNAKVPNYYKGGRGTGQSRRPSGQHDYKKLFEQLLKKRSPKTHIKKKPLSGLPVEIIESPNNTPDYGQSDEQIPSPDDLAVYEQIEQPSETMPNYPSDYEESAEDMMPLPDYPTDYDPNAETYSSTEDNQTDDSNIEEKDMCDKPAKYEHAREKLKEFFTKIKEHEYSKQIQAWLDAKKKVLIRKGAAKLNELAKNYGLNENESDETSYETPESDSYQKGVARTTSQNPDDDIKNETSSLENATWLQGIARMREKNQDPSNIEKSTSYSLRQYY